MILGRECFRYAGTVFLLAFEEEVVRDLFLAPDPGDFDAFFFIEN